MFFRHWKELDISPIELELDQDYVYYLHSRAWGLKGWLTGTHSWLGFWSTELSKWLVLELSDLETIKFQSANVIYGGSQELYERAPFVSDRDPRSLWFGARPSIVDRKKIRLNLNAVARVCQDYPFSQYRLLTQNCNSFFSYACFRLGLGFRRPLRSVGFKPASWWHSELTEPILGPRYSFRLSATALAALAFVSATSCVRDQNAPVVNSSGADVGYYENAFGVAPEALSGFFQSLKNEPARRNKRATDSSECLSSKPEILSSKGRDELLNCLSSKGADGLSPLFFNELFKRNIRTLRSKSLNAEVEKNARLNNYLLDVTRQAIARTAKASWFVAKDEEFLDLGNEQRNEFPFEDGDLVLTFGGAGTSGLVQRLHSPAFRLSHALIVRKRNGTTTTIEALPQSGTKEFSFDFFKNEKYYHVIVLRWRDQATRAVIAAKASDLAQRWAKNHVPFDYSFADSSGKSLYCTYMAGLAYARASGNSLDVILPDRHSKAPPEIVDLAHDIGINVSSSFVSPSTLLRSPDLEVVAEFRDTSRLMQSWQVESITNYVMAQYRAGRHLTSSWIYRNLDLVFAIPEIHRIALVDKSAKITSKIGIEKFARLATYEKSIIEASIDRSNKRAGSANLLEESLASMHLLLINELRAISSDRFVLRKIANL